MGVWTRSVITVCLLSREKPAVTLGCQFCSFKICMQSEMDKCLWMFVRGVSSLFACCRVKSLQSPWVASSVQLRLYAKHNGQLFVDVWMRSIITVCYLSCEKPAVTPDCQLCSIKLCMQSITDKCLWISGRGVSSLFACCHGKSLQSPWVASCVSLRFVCKVKWTSVCGCLGAECHHCLLVVA